MYKDFFLNKINGWNERMKLFKLDAEYWFPVRVTLLIINNFGRFTLDQSYFIN